MRADQDPMRFGGSTTGATIEVAAVGAAVSSMGDVEGEVFSSERIYTMLERFEAFVVVVTESGSLGTGGSAASFLLEYFVWVLCDS